MPRPRIVQNVRRQRVTNNICQPWKAHFVYNSEKAFQVLQFVLNPKNVHNFYETSNLKRRYTHGIFYSL